MILGVVVGLKRKKVVLETVGIFKTDNRLFGGALLGTIFLVGVLTFLRVLVLGPIAEFLTI